MYIKIESGSAVRYTLRQLRKDNPQVSFPAEPSLSDLASFGVYPATMAPAPDVTGEQVAERDAEPTAKGDGTYVWDWTVRNKPSDQLAEEARDERNALLTASDYTQLADSPRDKQAWATYRRALRDIPMQDGFPNNTTWPKEP